MIPPLVQGAGPGSVNIGVLGDLARRSDTMLAIFSDRLNHASLIDGIRTIRPQVSHLGTYDHDDAGVDRLREELEQYAEDAARVIVTDGVFSMEGDQAPLQTLVNLAVEFGALLIVDDPHGTGVLGARGCGSIEAQGVLGEVDVITSTIDKALGGAGADSSPVRPRSRQLLRALSRPYIFSNNPPYPVVAATLATLDLLETDTGPLAALRERIVQLCAGLDVLGLETVPGEHPIVPLVLGDEDCTARVAHALQERQIYVTRWSSPSSDVARPASACRFPPPTQQTTSP